MKCPRCNRATQWVEVVVHGGEPMRPREGFEYAYCRCGWLAQRETPPLSLFGGE